MKIIPRVVDLSHWDDVQDAFAGAVGAGIWGVINKVTESVGSHDKSFEWRRKPAADAGLLYGAYHFLRPGRIADQAKFFLDHIGDPSGLLLALDYEDAGVPLKDAKAWLEAVHDKVGRWPKFYFGGEVRDKLSRNSKDNKFWASLDLWHPQYGPAPNKCPAQWPEPWLWQYTGDGLGPNPHNIKGIKIAGKGIDINHFAGTLDQLKERWAA